MSLAIKLIVIDVDGTLTDGSISLGGNGWEMKSFAASDGLGMRLAQEAGLEIAILSGRSSDAVTQRMRELNVKRVIQGARFKAASFVDLLRDADIKADQTAYIGDDLNDLPAFRLASERIAVAGSPVQLTDCATYVTVARGGQGAVREAIEYLLRRDNIFDIAVEKYLTAEALPQ